MIATPSAVINVYLNRYAQHFLQVGIQKSLFLWGILKGGKFATNRRRQSLLRLGALLKTCHRRDMTPVVVQSLKSPCDSLAPAPLRILPIP